MPLAEDRRKRHAVNIAGWRGLGRVNVGVGVKPYEAHLSSLFSVMRSDRRECRDRDSVITAQNYRCLVVVKYLLEGGEDILAGCKHLLEMMRIVTVGAGLGQNDLNVAMIGHFISHRPDVLDKMGAAKLCETHRIHAKLAACLPGAKSERNAHDATFLSRHNNYISPKPVKKRCSTAASASASPSPSVIMRSSTPLDAPICRTFKIDLASASIPVSSRLIRMLQRKVLANRTSCAAARACSPRALTTLTVRSCILFHLLRLEEDAGPADRLFTLVLDLFRQLLQRHFPRQRGQFNDHRQIDARYDLDLAGLK